MENFKEKESQIEKTKHIESMGIGKEQRAQLTLVLLGLKPATDVSVFPWNSPSEEIENLLEKSGLQFIKYKNKRQEKTRDEYAVARDKETAERLMSADPRSTHGEYGTLMGYPQTAVEAFLKGELYDEPLPEDIENSIFKLRFSRDHYEEEFEVVRKWNQAIEEYCPSLIRS